MMMVGYSNWKRPQFISSLTSCVSKCDAFQHIPMVRDTYIRPISKLVQGFFLENRSNLKCVCYPSPWHFKKKLTVISYHRRFYFHEKPVESYLAMHDQLYCNASWHVVKSIFTDSLLIQPYVLDVQFSRPPRSCTAVTNNSLSCGKKC